MTRYFFKYLFHQSTVMASKNMYCFGKSFTKLMIMALLSRRYLEVLLLNSRLVLSTLGRNSHRALQSVIVPVTYVPHRDKSCYSLFRNNRLNQLESTTPLSINKHVGTHTAIHISIPNIRTIKAYISILYYIIYYKHISIRAFHNICLEK